MPTLNWIPLESNPIVFNGWANQAGLDPSAGDQFHDLYSLDDDYLKTIPRPVKAAILVFPYGEAKPRQDEEDERIERELGPGRGVDGGVVWIKQTIHNACGAMALLHSLANTEVSLTPTSPLNTFLTTARPLPPLERSALLESYPHFAQIHSSVSDAGQVPLPTNNEHVDQGYTAFVFAPSPNEKSGDKRRIVELDGGRKGPVDHGESKKGDLLEDVSRIVREEYVQKSKSGSVKFSVMYFGRGIGE